MSCLYYCLRCSLIVVKLHLKCFVIGVYPLDAIIYPAYERDLNAGLKTLLVDHEFCAQLSGYKKGVEIYNEQVKHRLDRFLKADLDSVHGHPEPLLDPLILKTFNNSSWREKKGLIFLDEVHLRFSSAWPILR